MSAETTGRRPRDGRRLGGVLAPVLTPFRQDLAPDRKRFARHCRWALGHGCAALAPFGTTSEANSLSVDEREQLLDALLEEGIPPDRLMPGTGCCAVTDTVRLTAQAVRRGCAGVLMLPPFYYKAVSDDGLFRAFAEVIERVGDDRLRVYLYHIPPVAQVGFGPKLVERLLRAYPAAIAGMKDSSGDFDNTRAMLERFAGEGFDVFVGTEKLLLQNMRAGGVGCITATGNVNPAAIDRLFREWRLPSAERLQEEVDGVRAIVERFPVIPALKAVVAHHACDPAWATVRPPLVELDTAARESLLAELAARRFEMPGVGGETAA
ncbi:dihydrodipicolinate synthase family protein [Anaeromyxobacter oryzisoli]|uniref:dihydrodipicolinate synthase family protein n=1 Tax=Anaeromyxobacter oryzisoli TaxID=2925408 RepID=UPI001F5655AD|nr:dihydrodipicolinate synthase family protein [Anaeromyxobacter sp. SG63]